MSFTSGTRVTSGKPCKANAEMDIQIANAEHVITKSQQSFARISVGSQSCTSGVTTTPSFSLDFDTDSYFSGGSPTRLTVPSGIGIVQIRLYYEWNSFSITDGNIWVIKNGSGFTGMPRHYFDKMSRSTLISPMLEVSAGDYFEVQARQNNGVAVTLRCVFSIRGIWT